MAAVTDRQERAMSFGSIAENYNELRPQAPQNAVDWLVPAGCRVAVDVGAGTGLFTRTLLGRVPQVIAVEPDARMREVLTAHSPGVRVVEGRGESIPLPDASADALFVSSAWHWMDPELAIPEIGRVLHDGGRLGLIWTSRDRDVDWVRRTRRAARPRYTRASVGGPLPATPGLCAAGAACLPQHCARDFQLLARDDRRQRRRDAGYLQPGHRRVSG